MLLQLPPPVKTGRRHKKLPYFFCDTCGRVYLTQDELTEHCSSAHDKAPLSSQSNNPTENPSNQHTALSDRDTSVVGDDPGTNGAEASATVTREIDRKKKKVGGPGNMSLSDVIVIMEGGDGAVVKILEG